MGSELNKSSLIVVEILTTRVADTHLVFSASDAGEPFASVSRFSPNAS